jgi:hypothetical protein
MGFSYTDLHTIKKRLLARVDLEISENAERYKTLFKML